MRPRTYSNQDGHRRLILYRAEGQIHCPAGVLIENGYGVRYILMAFGKRVAMLTAAPNIHVYVSRPCSWLQACDRVRQVKYRRHYCHDRLQPSVRRLFDRSADLYSMMAGGQLLPMTSTGARRAAISTRYSIIVLALDIIGCVLSARHFWQCPRTRCSPLVDRRLSEIVYKL